MQGTQNNLNKPYSHAEEKNWIGEANIKYGGLIGLALIMIQPFMSKGQLTGLPAQICVISFAVSTPILAGLLLLNHEEHFRKHLSNSLIAKCSGLLGQGAAVVGFVAGFWYINPLAGKVAVVSCIVAISAHSAGYGQLYMFKYKK